MSKKTLRDVSDLRGKRVLIRVDFNVPQDERGNVSSDRRIRAAVPTIQHALNAGAAVICMSHLGRPKGDPKKDAIFRMDPVAARLQEFLGQPVRQLDDVVGENVHAAVKLMQPGDVILLENLRFHPGEQQGDEAFAAQLAALGDVYVNDAFGTCHRTDASMYAVPKAMAGKPRVVGFLVAKELEILGQLLSKPPRPLIGVMGGAKVGDKIGFIKSMLKRVDKLLVGGAMTYTFMKALGQRIGSSRVEADKLDVAVDLLQLGTGKIVLPVDHLIADKPEASAQTRIVEGSIPDGWFGMDIGPKTIADYATEIARAGTVVWNGPLGKFEDEPFRRGTRAVAEALAACKGTTIVGGGETAEAVEAFGLDTKITHVSTGGGAFLEYVEGTPFKALEVIDERAKLRELLSREPGPHVLPALLECDLARLADVARQSQDAGARILHLDVMDGHFVPNLTYGPPVIRSLHRATSLLLDAHLMMSNPEKYIEPLAEAGCSTLTIHIEAVPAPRLLLERIRGLGVLAGLALNPPTSLDTIKPYLELCDLVLPLSVMPGWGGQKFDPVAIEKLRWLRQHGPKGLILESDGGLNRDTIGSVAAAGANLLVVGSALFRATDFAAEFAALTALARAG